MNVKSHISYIRHLAIIVKDYKSSSRRVLNDTRQLVKQAHVTKNPDLANENLIDLAVSYGSWHKRGITNYYVHRCGPGGSKRACYAAGPGSIPGRDKFPG